MYENVNDFEGWYKKSFKISEDLYKRSNEVTKMAPVLNGIVFNTGSASLDSNDDYSLNKDSVVPDENIFAIFNHMPEIMKGKVCALISIPISKFRFGEVTIDEKIIKPFVEFKIELEGQSLDAIEYIIKSSLDNSKTIMRIYKIYPMSYANIFVDGEIQIAFNNEKDISLFKIYGFISITDIDFTLKFIDDMNKANSDIVNNMIQSIEKR